MEENIFNTEIGKKFLALTKASFKVSDLISDLVLREKIKNQILNTYKRFIENNHSELLKEIDVLNQFFYLGGHLNLVKDEYLRQLQNGFLVFKSHIILALNNDNNINKKILTAPSAIQDMPDASVTGNRPKMKRSENSLSVKQKKILEKFESKNILKLAEILEIFPDISEKTVRNDLLFLISLGKITRSGQGNGSFYKLVK